MDAVPAHQSIIVTWDPPADESADGYRIYLDDEKVRDLPPSRTSITLTGLTNGEAYRVGVGVKIDGYVSGIREANVRPRAVPTAPRNLKVSSVDNFLTVTWSPPSGVRPTPVTRYRVQYVEPDGGWETSPLLGGTSRAAWHAAEAGGRYEILVRARNGAGWGPPASVTWTAPRVRVKAIDAQRAACALLESGVVRCFDNGFSLMGSSSERIGVSLLSGGPLVDATQLSIGRYSACAVTRDTTVSCWGDDSFDQLGDGPGDSSRKTASKVMLDADSPLDGVTQVSVGWWHACVVRTDTTVWCWGEASNGQTGQSDVDVSHTDPRQVQLGSVPLTGVVSVVAGHDATCALTAEQEVYCWGTDNGRLGVGEGTTFDMSPEPRPVVTDTGATLSGVRSIEGDNSFCATLVSSQVWCWGDNSERQLATGSTDDVVLAAEPVLRQVNGSPVPLTDITRTVSSHDTRCGITFDGDVWCWGDNELQQILEGGPNVVTDPVVLADRGGQAFAGVDGVVVADDALTCVLQKPAAITCMGWDEPDSWTIDF